MRVIKMITKKKCFDLLSNSLNYFFKEMYKGQYGEFICGYRGLKVKQLGKEPVRKAYNQTEKAFQNKQHSNADKNTF